MIVANVYLNPLKAHSHSFLRPFFIMYFAFRQHMHVVAHNDQYLFCPLHIQENISSITPLSAQISASKYQNLSQSPLKTMIPWSNLRKITKRSFSDTLKLCNPSDAILEVNTVTQLSDQIFVQKWLRNKLLQFLDRLD